MSCSSLLCLRTLEQRSRNEIQDCSSTRGYALQRHGIFPRHNPHHGCAGEIENDYCNHGRNEMQGINRAELAVCLARLKNLRNAVEQGAKIRFRDPLEVVRPAP